MKADVCPEGLGASCWTNQHFLSFIPVLFDFIHLTNQKDQFSALLIARVQNGCWIWVIKVLFSCSKFCQSQTKSKMKETTDSLLVVACDVTPPAVKISTRPMATRLRKDAMATKSRDTDAHRKKKLKLLY